MISIAWDTAQNGSYRQINDGRRAVKSLQDRVDERVREWGIVVHSVRETRSSCIVFGMWKAKSVVLKVIRDENDEWDSAEVLRAFDGHGAARVYEQTEGALLLERLQPATALADIALNGDDDHATGVIADVIRRMSHSPALPAGFVTVFDWAAGFQRYRESGNGLIDRELVNQGERIYLDLAMSQRHVRLLHGDLHHYNVLLDSERGWIAIDPKGVVGELEYEVGAALRNPVDSPDLFASPTTIATRLSRFEAELALDSERVLAWGFAQAVLAAIWTVEDGLELDSQNQGIRLANAVRPMLARSKFY